MANNVMQTIAGAYYCNKCERMHVKGSKIYKAHLSINGIKWAGKEDK